MDQLISEQQELFGRIARTIDNLKKAGTSKITLALVQASLKSLDEKWARFEDQHVKLRHGYWESLREHEYLKSDFMAQVEDMYTQQRASLFEVEQNLVARKTAEDESRAKTSAAGTVGRSSLATLPRIQLPQFSGRVEDWPAFRDLFTSLIGKEGLLSQVEKLHYLKVSVTGSAEELIRNLPVTGDNFMCAWALLTNHYENKRLLVRSYLSAFTTLPKMKTESAPDLRKILNGVLTTTAALEGIGRPITSSTDLFIHLVVDLFDSRTRREWENQMGGHVDPATYGDLRSFLERKLSTLDALSSAKAEHPAAKGEGSSRAARTLHAGSQDNTRKRCPLCSKPHFVLFCEKYKAKSAQERKDSVRQHNLCFNCLGRHMVSACGSSKSCVHCAGRHHSSLHDACGTAAPAAEAVTPVATSHMTLRPPAGHRAVILATARVRVTDRFGAYHRARALIDPGSEVSLISEALVQRLRLQRSASAVAIVGVGEQQSGTTRGRVCVRVASRFGDSAVKVPVLILPRLTSYGRKFGVAATAWPFLDGLELADPDPFGTESIEVLLGADVFPLLLREGVRRGGPGELVAQRTSLGWIVSGAVDSTTAGASFASHQCSVDDGLAAAVRRFWEQEEAAPGPPPVTPEEERCLQHFATTHRRTSTGRYVVRLPFKTEPQDLSDTRHAALRSMQAAERRFLRDPEFQRLYAAFMQEFETLGHMSPVAAKPNGSSSRGCFLPHHGVLKGVGSKAKIRVVFNGSQRTRTGGALNDVLAVGPNLLPRLADVLLRWRRHRFVFATDMEKMYRQVEVHPDDRCWQKIMWLVGDKLQEFRINTVTYGLASAPFLAIRTLQQLASDEGDQLPLGAAILRGDVYVDDVLAGAPSMDEALTSRRELEELTRRGGFPLRKWAANEDALLDGIPQEHRSIQPTRSWRPEERHATLGLEWGPHEDSFTFVVRPMEERAATRRGILSQAAKLFDPLGWLSPVIIGAKCIVQSTWTRRTGWDDQLPDEDVTAWDSLRRELPLLGDIRVPRWVGLDQHHDSAEIHGFADASERAYAAVLYLRVVRGSEARVTLLLAKTKVAPLKQVSLPRLELCAASLLATVAAQTVGVLGMASSSVHLWTDSTVALGWIRGHPCRWTTYVANRVAEIQRQLPEAQWHHVAGTCNPADCASRGVAPSALLSHALWWNGPDFLGSREWSSSSPTINESELPEQRKVVRLVETEPSESELLTRHSSLHRLLRVTAWMKRWRTAPGGSHRRGQALSPTELTEAEHLWIRHVQATAYSAEISSVRAGGPLPGRSPLKSLTPFQDEAGILRVGGRLKHAVLSYDERHPVILPPGSHLSKLVIDAYHRRTLHGGVQLTLGLIRRRFWMPRGRQLIKGQILHCPPCLRWRAASPQPKMSNLPEARTASCRPFRKTGVDYAGPIMVRSARGRGHKAFKAFIAIFVCFSSRAVHLEAVSDYTADAFLAAFRRFTSRRGACLDVYSDCGTNFVGADAQLRALFKASTKSASEIVNQLANDRTAWHFNPPGAPHFGGLWEAAVKSVKHHLRRVIGSSTLTFEEMTTLLTQVEACLNSRPLQALSDDPEDLAALTPGHFLIGEPLCSLPEPSLQDAPSGRLNRWQLIQQMRDHLWRRWSQEYVTSLAPRNKWCKEAPKLQEGQLCLVRSETSPPSRWPLARITQLHPGEDGEIRVVTVRTATTTLTRPSVKIIPLPFASEEKKK